MPLSAGDMVGDYRVLDLIGTGGMGHVYKVQNVLSNRVEAMKVVIPDKSNELNERFLREIQVQASLIHPNITGLHTALRFDGQVIMIMELVEGETVRDRLERGAMRIGECLEYGRQILDALAYAHRRNVVHRDIKPANIMLTTAGQAKLMDFGLASVGSDRRLTRTGTVMGSLYYMAPEQVKGQPLSPKSDLYSFGLTLYEMLTGVRGINGDSDYAIMTAHLQMVPTAPMVCNPDIPQALSDLVLKAVAKDAEARFPSAEHFRDALESFARSAPAPALETSIPVTESAPKQEERKARPIAQDLSATEVLKGDVPRVKTSETASPRTVPSVRDESRTEIHTAPQRPRNVVPASAPISSEMPVAATAPPSEPIAPAQGSAPSTSPPQSEVHAEVPEQRQPALPRGKPAGLWIMVGAAAGVLIASLGIYKFVAAPSAETEQPSVSEQSVPEPRTTDLASSQTPASGAATSASPAAVTAAASRPASSTLQPASPSTASADLPRAAAVAPESVRATAPAAARRTATPAPVATSAPLAAPAPTATTVPVTAPPKPPQKTAEQILAEEAARVWETIATSTDPSVLRSFQSRYPQSSHAGEALGLAQKFESQAAAARAAAEASARKAAEEAAARRAADEAARKAAEANAAMKQEVLALLGRLEKAYGAQDLPQIRAAWPTIESEHVKRLQESFRDSRTLSVSLEPTADPRATQSGAVVECRYTMVAQLKSSKAARRAEGTATVILKRAPGGWVVDDIDYRMTSRSLFKPL